MLADAMDQLNQAPISATPVADSIWQQAVAKLSPRVGNKRFARTSKILQLAWRQGSAALSMSVYSTDAVGQGSPF